MSGAIRDERAGDEPAIAGVTETAFRGEARSDGSEVAIVERLRAAGSLVLSLVAEADGAIIGHVAFSPVTIGETGDDFCGLGPVSVLPDCQGEGIGTALVRTGLERLQALGVRGCVVLGEPGFYRRFGFEHDPRLTYPGPPPEYFQRIVFSGPAPEGQVNYSPAFG